MAVFAVAVATGDIIKYHSFVYGSFVWGIHVRYNKYIYIFYTYINILNGPQVTMCTLFVVNFVFLLVKFVGFFLNMRK